MIEDVTSDLVYVRLHGETELYASGYDDERSTGGRRRCASGRPAASPADARTLAGPARAGRRQRDVFVYFDNDIKVRAPYDSMALAARLGDRAGAVEVGRPSSRSGASAALEPLDQAAVALGRAARAAVALARRPTCSLGSGAGERSR